MRFFQALTIYLLIGGVFAGAGSVITKDAGEKPSDEALMFIAVAWPAGIGMVVGSILAN